MSDRVLLIADAQGLVLDRLAQSWRTHWTRSPHDVVYSASHHPYELRRQSDRSRLVFWIDPLAFSAAPRSSLVPQIVMAHHATEAEVEPYRSWLASADAITTPSLRWQKKWSELTGRNVWRIPATIDTRAFVPRSQSEELRRRLGIADRRFVIGFSARAKSDAFGRKGIDLFLDVIAEASRVWDDLTVLLIGSGWETTIRRIESIPCPVISRVVAATEETAELYPAMDVFLCTSREEGGPHTILEAMACGVPVISTDVGHVPELITDGETGFIVRERTAALFVDAVKVLRTNRELHGRITGEARRFVEQERDHAQVLPMIDYENIYREAETTFRSRGAGVTVTTRLRRAALAARYSASRVRRRWRSD